MATGRCTTWNIPKHKQTLIAPTVQTQLKPLFLDRYSDVVLEGISGLGNVFAKEDYRNFLQYLSYVAPDEYAPHKEMYDEECSTTEEDEES